MTERARTLVQRLRTQVARPAWRRSKKIRWTIGVGLVLIIATLFPSAQQMALSGYSIGSLWTGETVTAPFSYPVYKDVVRYRQDVHKALDELYPVYRPDTMARDRSL